MSEDAAEEDERERLPELPGAFGRHAGVVTGSAADAVHDVAGDDAPASASSSTEAAKRARSATAGRPSSMRVNTWSRSSALVRPQSSSARGSIDVGGARPSMFRQIAASASEPSAYAPVESGQKPR